MLLEESLKDFLFECEVRKYTPKTVRCYRNGLNFLANYLKQEHQLENLEDIQTKHLKAFFMYQSKRGRKETYLNGLLKTFRAFFKYHMDAENIVTNPVLKVSWMKEPKTIIKTFSNEEVKGMLQAYSGSDSVTMEDITQLVATATITDGATTTTILNPSINWISSNTSLAT